MNVYLPNLRLPSEYQEVEYIQSSGTQYINTGYVPSNNTKIEMSMGGWNTSVGQYANLFGARYNWSASGRGFQLGYNRDNSSPVYYAMFGKVYENMATSVFSFVNGNNHIIQMSQSGIYEDGSLKKSLDSITFTSPVNMAIFANNANGTNGEFGSYKLYYFKIYDNGTLVRDFIPCYRKSDNVIGLYDLVNNQFYTNSGTGTFSKGNDVTMPELQNAYIGEYTGEIIICDFTQGYNDFTFYRKNYAGSPSYVQYGRDSNGLYTINTGNINGEVDWNIPSSITSKTLKKAVFEAYGTTTGNGVGLLYYDSSAGIDKAMRFFNELDCRWGTQNQKGSRYSSPVGNWTFTLDLENKLMSTSINSETLTITDNAISVFNTDWANGDVKLANIVGNSNVYAYCKKVTFYVY